MKVKRFYIYIFIETTAKIQHYYGKNNIKTTKIKNMPTKSDILPKQTPFKRLSGAISHLILTQPKSHTIP